MDRKIILIVDDNFKNLQLIGQILKAEGYSIILSPSAENTFKILKENKPDLFLLDVMMPEMDGFELCKKIKENESMKNIPVIFLTAKVDTENLIEGFNAGGVDYITKPFNKDELLARVKNHIELADARIQLKQQADMIIEMNKSREKMYSIIAHDIRSPLAIITMMLETLFDNKLKDDDKFQEILTQLAATTKETSLLLENLLLWTKSQSGKISFASQKFKVSENIQDCINVQKFKINKKNIQLITEFNDNQPISTDPNMFSTIIRNLLSNAIKFTPKEGSIIINVNQNDENTEISINDSGVGFKPEELEKFRQNILFTNYGTDYETGSGLGLSLVKEFVARCNASMDVDSKPNEGTKFRLIFKNH